MTIIKRHEVGYIEFFGSYIIDGHIYRYKDYLYKSEIYRDGKLVMRLNNRLPVVHRDYIEIVDKNISIDFGEEL